MNDKALLNRIQQGDTDAYNQMFGLFYSPLCEYASQYISDADAEELVQDLMVYVWENRKHLVVEKSLKSYLFVSVKNRCYNVSRNKQSRINIHSYLYDKLKDQFEDPDYYMIDEITTSIAKAIEELPESYRETFKMSRFDEMPNSEIANHLNVSVKTVEYRITQSLKILRVKLKDYFPLFLFLLK
ncbi:MULTISPECIES: RNA polymerase sigma-70 factor [unclassified Parabacteroides]|uniref:RNA polymerase sigma-70 factor n=1 Tax=unclassified Parabacteroides TaxID=2649774 RepID=UPI0024760EE0|nr:MULTISPECIES: RNA polymerase sigma-70 factor [unclassified Parabacteroides]